ncbi:MAG TPA: DUF397 domain-containing protein [Pseudonocardiaceae bacterium]|nr:DUF397 domain-containing protein [Pseudonocardiaceae bacterium]
MTTTRVAPPATLADATYTKSTRSGATGNCVEVAALSSGHRAVRDSKHPTGPTLTVTAATWTAFTTTLRTSDPD